MSETPKGCGCGHDHLMPFGTGWVRTAACREWPKCKCMAFRPADEAEFRAAPPEEVDG